jgi:hypothetical protein
MGQGDFHQGQGKERKGKGPSKGMHTLEWTQKPFLQNQKKINSYECLSNSET